MDTNSLINDIRSISDFKTSSFSKYKKTNVCDKLEETMLKRKVEPACYWSAELICSCHYIDLWETILFFIGKHIHLANPKLFIYIENRYIIFRNIVEQKHYISELDLRNNPTIRKLFAEIICNITLSEKKHAVEPIKIDREEEFDITHIHERLIAPSIEYIEPIFQKKDPEELRFCMNELAYNISLERKNMTIACHWIEWLIEFDSICRKRKDLTICSPRHMPVEAKYQTNSIWIVWDIFFYYVKKVENSVFIEKILNSLLKLFCIRYTHATPKKRKYLLYFAVELLTEHVPTNVEIVSNKEFLQVVVENIDVIYKEIKKNEESPNTDYLFMGLNEKQQNLQQSLMKMKMVENMDFFGGQPI